MPGLNLSATDQIIGDWEPPQAIAENRADMALLWEARKVLKYKGFLTLHYWWTRFPSPTWWRYAIAATKYFARVRNYRYFLKSLLSAARMDAHYQQSNDYLQVISRQEFSDAMTRQAALDVPPCGTCRGRSGGCEDCDPAILEVRAVAKNLTKPIDCFDCHGRVCARCVRLYLQVLTQLPEKGVISA